MRVIDGDTVDIRAKGRVLRIRLAAIDCPEDGQVWGEQATWGLIKMIGGKSVDIEPVQIDPHGRTVATLFVRGPDGSEINVCERMVMLGHAWVMRRYYTALPKPRRGQLDRLERWARSRRVGLWKAGDAIPPWEWRRRGEGCG